jgi:hypothetical protein
MIAALRRWSREVDRVADRGLERAYPPLLLTWRRGSKAAKRSAVWLGPRLRPLMAFFFRALGAGEHAVRWACTLLVRMATAASRVITPSRAAGAVLIVAGALLVVSQFIDYRGVEIGQPGYAGLPDVAQAPTVEVRTAGEAHLYLLVPVGLIAMAIGVLALRREAKRLGLLVAALGVLSLAVILVVDLPNGLDEGNQASRFAGTSAVLQDGFYAELAAAGGLLLAGLLYYARPCRIRISLSGRAESARRRRPRRRASSRVKVARRA